MRRGIALACAVVMLSGAVEAEAQRPTIGTWVSAGQPYGIWKNSHGRRFPVDIIVPPLAEAGVTEVMFFHQRGRGGPFLHPTKVRHAQTEASCYMGKRDFLKELLDETQKHNMKVWLVWTPPAREYPGTDIVGLSDPRMLKVYTDMVEEVGRKYGHHDNLIGIHWHEVHCGVIAGDNADTVKAFAAFCEQRFGEAYAGTRMPKVNPENRWFRRRMLYHSHLTNSLVRVTRKAAAPFGFEVSFCYYPPEAGTGTSWRRGIDIVALEDLCEHLWFVGFALESGKPYQTIRGAWIDFGPSYKNVNLSRNYAYGFHGSPLYFFNFRVPLFLPEIRRHYGADVYSRKYGHTEKVVDLFLGKQNIKNWAGLMSAWQGGDSPAKVAVAVNPVPFVMKYPHGPGAEYKKKVQGLMLALTEAMDVDGLVLGSQFARDSANLRRYSLIIVPQGMGGGLTQAMAKSLREYVAAGGRLLAMATPLIQSRADLTGGRDLTAELFGVEVLRPRQSGYVRPEGALAPLDAGKQWMESGVDVRVSDAQVVVRDGATGNPLVLRRGNGWFVTMGFSPKSADLIRRIAREAAAPLPATLESNVGLRILESARLDGSACLSLWGVGQAKLVADAAVLGLRGERLQAKDLVSGAVLAEADVRSLARGVPIAIKHLNQPLVVAIGSAARLDAFRGIYPSADVFEGMEEWDAIENPEVPIVVPDKPGIKVGVYGSGLPAGVLVETLKDRPGLNVFLLSRIDEAALKNSQVILLPQASSRRFFNRARDAVRNWVRHGGRIMLFHDSVGYKGLKPYFPEVGEGETNPKTHEALVVKVHPVTAGLRVGQTIHHAYTDHVGMKLGPQGDPLLVDERELAVLVAGTVGQGKVLLNGMITGYASVSPGDYQGRECAPKDEELLILLNAVKWLAADGKQ